MYAKFKLFRLSQAPAPVRMGAFLSLLLLLWLPRAALIYWMISTAPNGDSPVAVNWISILTMGLLFGDFLFLLKIWGQQVYQEPRLIKRYGLSVSRKNGFDLLEGLVSGGLLVLVLFGLQGFLGWLVWQPPKMSWLQLILEGFLSALGIGFAEELVFRGWFLDELQRDYRPNRVLWVNAMIFAALHFLKPLPEIIRTFPQFPGLVIVGLTLVWAKRSRKGRLGICIGLHAGLVWGYYIINVGDLVKYSGAVPDWVTGIDRNPVAGLMGLALLGIGALWMRWQSRRI